MSNDDKTITPDERAVLLRAWDRGTPYERQRFRHLPRLFAALDAADARFRNFALAMYSAACPTWATDGNLETMIANARRFREEAEARATVAERGLEDALAAPIYERARDCMEALHSAGMDAVGEPNTWLAMTCAVIKQRDAARADVERLAREAVLHGEALTIEVDAHAVTTATNAALRAEVGRLREALCDARAMLCDWRDDRAPMMQTDRNARIDAALAPEKCAHPECTANAIGWKTAPGSACCQPCREWSGDVAHDMDDPKDCNRCALATPAHDKETT